MLTCWFQVLVTLLTVSHGGHYVQTTTNDELWCPLTPIQCTVQYDLCYVHPRFPTLIHQRITTSGFLKARIQYHHNSDATFQLRLLVAGDVNPNPGPDQCPSPSPTSNFGHRITYDRDTLLEFKDYGKFTHINPDVWNCLRSLKINSMRVTHRGKGPGIRFRTDSPNEVEPELSNVSQDIRISTRKDDRNCKVNNIDSDDVLKTFTKKGIHIINLNARSICPKMSELKLIASNTRAKIITVCETWLDDSVTDNEINIPDFSVIRKDRNKNGGGTCIYIHSDLAFNPRPDLDIPKMEAIWTEILLPRCKPFIVGSCYRPEKHTQFIINLESVLSKLPADSEVIILGDMNMCALRKDRVYTKYANMLHLFGHKQLIHTPTRITPTTKSALDHIICNYDNVISQYGVVTTGLSDHFFTYCTRKSPKPIFNEHKRVKVRSLKNYSKESFIDKLSETDWSEVLFCNDVDRAWSMFCTVFMNTLDSVAPLREVRIKQRSEPWMTSEILDDIRERDSLLAKFNKNKHMSEYYKEYCKLRNKVQREIRSAKQQYILHKIEANKNDSKKLWKNLKELGYQNKTKDSTNMVLDIDGKKCFENKEVANHFNKFFTGVAAKLAGELPEPSGLYDVNSNRFQSYYSHIRYGSFELHEVSEVFVYDELTNLNIDKSTGLDGLPARFLKDAADVIKTPITYIINLSIRTEVFPSEMKIAKVKPLYKKKSRLEVGNYRPVSILSVASKILEKAVFVQFNRYLTENNIIFKFQSGFRGKYSTDTCLIYLQDHIRNQISAGLFTGMVLLDIQKAFDSVNHSILCQKLTALGMNSTKWFESYLNCRSQIVNVNGSDSDSMALTCGVPQGSILGPILFLCYVNDMPNCVDCMLLQYADDSALLVSDKDPLKIGQQLSKNLESCNKWLIDNKLSLHMGKTELILFGTKRKLKNWQNYTIECEGQTIHATPSVKYLGLTIDQCLNGEEMGLGVIKKVNSRLKFLYRQAKFLDQNIKKILCSALVLCLFDYSISSWHAGTYKQMSKSLQIAQNKVIRFILNKDYMYHITEDDFKNLNFLNIQNRAKQLRLNHVFDIFNEVGPDYLSSNFTRVSNVHQYSTRNSAQNFRVPKSTTIISGSFYYNAIQDWANLPSAIKSISDKPSFKKSVKTHLFNQI